MATTEVTEQNFDDIVMGNDLVLLDFWAAWCGPCVSFGPTYEKVSAQFPDAVFGKIDTEAQQALAATFNIQSIPTLMVIREQVVLYSEAGALPESALVEIVTKALELDMEEIHRDIAEQNDDDNDAEVEA